MKSRSEILKFNQAAWDGLVKQDNVWTRPVSSEQVLEARRGELKLLLTPEAFVPAHWYPFRGAKVLGLASGGGQQGPLLAAAAYDVTVLDNSPLQLAQDRMVAERESLDMKLVLGDMADLSQFEDDSFDFIFHPCSNCFVPDVNPVWKECYRVLKKGGQLASGFVNPILFMLDPKLEKEGIAQIRFALPYSDLKDLSEVERVEYFGEGEPYTFGHTLNDQIGGQMRAGFLLKELYEDGWKADVAPLHKYMKAYLATLAIKL